MELVHIIVSILLLTALLTLLFGNIKCKAQNPPNMTRFRSLKPKALPSDDLHPLVGTTCWQQATMPYSLTIAADDAGNLTNAQICSMNPDGSCISTYALTISGNMLVGEPFGAMGYLASNNIFQTSAGVYLTKVDCPQPPSSKSGEFPPDPCCFWYYPSYDECMKECGCNC